MNKYSELEILKAKARDEIKMHKNLLDEVQETIEALEENIEKWESQQLSIVQGILFRN